MLVLSLVFTSNAVSACTMCFSGDPNGTANIALRNAMLFLIVTIGAVLLLFARFFLNMQKRAKLNPKNH